MHNLLPMKHPLDHKKFIFNKKMDSAFLFSLYEEEYADIKDIFQTSLQSINEELVTLQNAYKNRKLDLVKKAAHKIKPVFGFTGLLLLEQKTAHFETLCSTAASVESIKEEFDRLVLSISEGKSIIEHEYKRLTD